MKTKIYSSIQFRALLKQYETECQVGCETKINYSYWQQLVSIAKGCADVIITTIKPPSRIQVRVENNTDMVLMRSDIPDEVGFINFLINQNDIELFEEKEDTTMNTNDIISFDFGPVTSDACRLSMYGIACQSSNGKYVSYDKDSGSIVNVNILNFPGKNLCYKVPVAIKDIKRGDVIIHQNHLMFVCADPKPDANDIEVIDYRNSERKYILPVKSMFGFDYYTKIITLVDMSNLKANADQPFGNMLPFLMMQNSDLDPMSAMMLFGNGGFDMSNPMMMYALCANGGKDNSALLMAMMMQNGVKSNG